MCSNLETDEEEQKVEEKFKMIGEKFADICGGGKFLITIMGLETGDEGSGTLPHLPNSSPNSDIFFVRPIY